jgi:hypothetical protein
MSDFKHLTVRTLRELAREHLGRGHSRLKTKDELVGALKRAVPHLLEKLRGTAPEEKPATMLPVREEGPVTYERPAGTRPEVARASESSVDSPSQADQAEAATVTRREADAREVASPSGAAAAPVKKSVEPVETGTPIAAAARASASPERQEKVASAPSQGSVLPPASASADETAASASLPLREAGPIAAPSGRASSETASPDDGWGPLPGGFEAVSDNFFVRSTPNQESVVEGFFLARMDARDLARRSPPRMGSLKSALSPMSPSGEEDLGELPAHYPEESLVLLPRDPRSIYFFWDFRPALARGVAAGLPAPRAVVRVLSGDTLIREQAFSLDSGSFFLSELAPGQTYRVECFVRGADGRTGPLRLVSNEVELPPEGPSPSLDVQVMNVPWNAPLGGGATEPRASEGHLPSSQPGPGSLPSSAMPRVGEGAPVRDMPRPEQTAPDWAKGPRLDLPSSHSLRGAKGDASPSSPPGRG